jgi:hypothetical protein
MSIKTSALLAALTLGMLVAAPVQAAPRPTAAVVEKQDVRTPKPARASDDAARYAQRESKAKKQQNYQGGDVLVIGISAGAAIIALIIVLLLI